MSLGNCMLLTLSYKKRKIKAIVPTYCLLYFLLSSLFFTPFIQPKKNNGQKHFSFREFFSLPLFFFFINDNKISKELFLSMNLMYFEEKKNCVVKPKIFYNIPQ